MRTFLNFQSLIQNLKSKIRILVLDDEIKIQNRQHLKFYG